MLARPHGGGPLTVRQQADLDQALHGTLALQRSARRLSRLIEFLDPTDPEGIHARLARWCASTQATTPGYSITPRIASCRGSARSRS